MIIDDEEIVRITIPGMLKKMGYKVLVAEHGEQGLDLFQKNLNQISVVLLDMDMPKLSGAEVFRKIKKIKDSAKVIIVSGFSHDDKIIDFHKEGLSSFLQKPFSVTLLDQTLRKVILNPTEH